MIPGDLIFLPQFINWWYIYLYSIRSSFILLQAQTPEYELETLTGKGGHSDSPPPEYHSILVTRGAEHQEDDTLPPDYFDDIVNKVVI